MLMTDLKLEDLAGFRGQRGSRGRGGARGVGDSEIHYDEEIIESEEESGSEILFRVEDFNLAEKNCDFNNAPGRDMIDGNGFKDEEILNHLRSLRTPSTKINCLTISHRQS